MLDKHNVRALLIDIGVGDFNATMAIPYMFIAPRATDPAAVQVIVVIRKMQEALAGMGAPGVVPSGMLDGATDDAMQKLLGSEWLAMPYYEALRAIVGAESRGYQFEQPTEIAPAKQGVGGFMDSLPAVPGGIVTYGLGALALWHFFLRKR